jgi:hypothetical protein
VRGKPARGELPAHRQAPVRYRFEFDEGGELTAARAWGPGADLLIEATGSDMYRCKTSGTVSFRETLRERCHEFQKAYPGMSFNCSR